jgi:hypothetical protein
VPGLVLGEGRECGAAGIDLVAVGALEPRDALSLKHGIEEAAGPAIAYATKIRS